MTGTSGDEYIVKCPWKIELDRSKSQDLFQYIEESFAKNPDQAIFVSIRKYYPSSKQFRDPPTYTHQPSMQQKVPFLV